MSGATVRVVVPVPMRLLAAAGFLSMAGARVIDPLLAVIARDFRVPIAEVAVIIAAFTLPYGLNQLVLGPIGDRFGKLRVLLGALLGYAVATAGCALATTLPWLTLVRAAAGAASAGIIPVALAYIGDCVPYSERQATLGRFLTGVAIAQMLAGPLGGVFGQYLSWRGVFVLLSVSALMTAAVLAIRMPELHDRRHTEAVFDWRTYATLSRDRPATLLLLSTIAEGALMAGCFPFLAPYLHDRFGLPPGLVGVVLACFGIGAFGYTRAAKRLVTHFPEPTLALIGGAAMAGSLAVGMGSGTWPAFVVVELLLGAGYLTLHGVLQARATELLPNARATAVAGFVFMLFFGQTLGALGMGAAIGALGYRTAFWADSAGIALLALWLALLLRRPPA